MQSKRDQQEAKFLPVQSLIEGYGRLRHRVVDYTVSPTFGRTQTTCLFTLIQLSLIRNLFFAGQHRTPLAKRLLAKLRGWKPVL